MEIVEHTSIQPFNTFGIDVNARFYAEIVTEEDIEEIPEIIKSLNVPFMVLGGGSNILFTKDYPGVLFHNKTKKLELLYKDDDHYYVKCSGGYNWHQFVLECIDNHWGGVENLSLIPGCVGASPIQNIGAYGVELKDIFEELEAFDLKTGDTHVYKKDDCEFGYRDSIFKRHAKGKYLIKNVTFKFNKNHQVNTSYGAIENELEAMGIKHPTIKDVSTAVTNIRSSKLPNPKEIGNAGSFFKNPVIPQKQYDKLKQDFPEIPFYPVSEDQVKVPAGWLIDKAGWKGKDFGGYGVHEKQALVLVNKSKASGQEIYNLSEEILEDVFQRYGIQLEREVNIL